MKDSRNLEVKVGDTIVQVLSMNYAVKVGDVAEIRDAEPGEKMTAENKILYIISPKTGRLNKVQKPFFLVPKA